MPNVNSSMLRSKVCLIPNGANYLLTVAVAEKDIPTPTLITNRPSRNKSGRRF
jgi:hypothetical protein